MLKNGNLSLVFSLRYSCTDEVEIHRAAHSELKESKVGKISL